jgi:hypothetical protein
LVSAKIKFSSKMFTSSEIMAMLSKTFILRWKKVPRGVRRSPNMIESQATNVHEEI